MQHDISSSSDNNAYTLSSRERHGLWWYASCKSIRVSKTMTLTVHRLLKAVTLLTWAAITPSCYGRVCASISHASVCMCAYMWPCWVCLYVCMMVAYVCVSHSAHAIACVPCIYRAYDANESPPCDKMTLTNKCKREGKTHTHRKKRWNLAIIYKRCNRYTAVYVVYTGNIYGRLCLMYKGCTYRIWLYIVFIMYIVYGDRGSCDVLHQRYIVLFQVSVYSVVISIIFENSHSIQSKNIANAFFLVFFSIFPSISAFWLIFSTFFQFSTENFHFWSKLIYSSFACLIPDYSKLLHYENEIFLYFSYVVVDSIVQFRIFMLHT